MEKGFSIKTFEINATRGKPHCKFCKKQFTLSKREHQCKRCLRPVCSECVPSRHPIFLSTGKREQHRCCSTCKSQILYIQTLIVTQRISLCSNSGFGERMFKRALSQVPAIEGQKIKQLIRLTGPKIQKYKKLTASIKAEQLFGSLNPSMREFVFLCSRSSLQQIRERVEQLNIALINCEELNLSSQLFHLNLFLLTIAQFDWAFTISRWIFRGLKQLKSIKLNQHISELTSRFQYFSGLSPSKKILDFINNNISMLICTLLINCLKAQSLFVLYDEQLQAMTVDSIYRIAVIYLLTAKDTIQRGELQILPTVFNEVRNGQIKATLSSIRKKVQFKSFYNLQESSIQMQTRPRGQTLLPSHRFSHSENNEGLSDSPKSRSIGKSESRQIQGSFEDDCKTLKPSRTDQAHQLIRQIVRVREANLKLQRQLEQQIVISKANCSCQTEQPIRTEVSCQTFGAKRRKLSVQIQTEIPKKQFLFEESMTEQTHFQTKPELKNMDYKENKQEKRQPLYLQVNRLQMIELKHNKGKYQELVLPPLVLERSLQTLDLQMLQSKTVQQPQSPAPHQLAATQLNQAEQASLLDQLNQANLRCQYLKHRQAVIQQQVTSKNLQIENLRSKLTQKEGQLARLKSQFERLVGQFQQELGQDGIKPECKPF